MNYSPTYSQQAGPSDRSARANFWLVVAGFLVFLPEASTTTGDQTTFPTLFELVGGGVAGVVLKLYVQLLVAGLLLRVATTQWRFPQSSLFTWGCIVSFGAAFWAYALSLRNEMGLVQTLRLNGNACLMITAVAFLAGAQGPSARTLVKSLLLGGLAAEALTLCYWLGVYRSFGAPKVIVGVASFQTDGGTLMMQAVLGAWAAVAGVDNLLRKRWRPGALWLVSFVILGAALSASFRRFAVVMMLGTSLGGVLILSWLRGRLKQGLVTAAGVCLVAVTCVTVSYLLIFGPQVARGRLASLSFDRDQLRTARGDAIGSTDGYLSFWDMLPDLLQRSLPAGAGFQVDYGVYSAGYPIPAHIGSFELWISLGVVGVIYHLLFLVAVPLTVLATVRRPLPDSVDGPLFSVLISYALFVALWPFIAPYHTVAQSCLLIGLGLGYGVSLCATPQPRARADGALRPLAAPPAPKPSPAPSPFWPRLPWRFPAALGRARRPPLRNPYQPALYPPGGPRYRQRPRPRS